MEQLAAAAEAIAATTKKSEKVRLLADYLRARTVEEAAVSAVFLSGRAFPAREEATLQVGARCWLRRCWRYRANASRRWRMRTAKRGIWARRRMSCYGETQREQRKRRNSTSSRLRGGSARWRARAGRQRKRCWCAIC